MTSYIFCIAQHYIKLDFDDQYIIRKQLLLPFMPFMVKEIEDHNPLLFTLTVTQDNIQAGNEAVSRMSTVDTGNGDIIVDRLPNGGYQYTIKNIESQKCCLRSEEHTSELQSRQYLVCRLLLEKKKKYIPNYNVIYYSSL